MNERIRNFIMSTLKAMIKEHREESYVREYAFANYEKNRITENDLFEIEDLIAKEYHSILSEIVNDVQEESEEADESEEAQHLSKEVSSWLGL